MLGLALTALRSRLAISLLVGLSICASMVLLLSVDRIKQAAEEGFAQSISGVDLLVGARTGELDLLLYSVFHVGQPVSNITTQTADDIRAIPMVDWVVPISLGDSHKGYRVTATTPEYFSKVKLRNDQVMEFSQGRAFQNLNEVVIGSEVANALKYALGDKVYLSHGTSGLPGSEHDDFAFEVVGILEPTGTPTDRVLLIDLKGFELIHLGWKSGSKLMSLEGKSVDQIPAELLESKSVTALYVGAKSRLQLLRLKRSLNDYNQEALSAVLPGAALSRMWRLMGTAENSIKVLGWLVLLISIVSMVSTSLASLESRTREMTILRSLGASPLSLGIMVMIESLIISLTAAVMAVLLLSYVSDIASSYLSSEFGFTTTQQLISFDEVKLLMIIVLAGLMSSLWPAWRVYRQQLTKGLA